MTDERKFADVVEEWFPYDGPHTGERVTGAAGAVSALVRYLNNATRQPVSAPDMHDLLSGLHIATAGMDQLYRQLAEQAAAHAEDPSLRHDEGDRELSQTTAQQAAVTLRLLPAELRVLSASINEARRHYGHLYHDTSGN